MRCGGFDCVDTVTHASGFPYRPSLAGGVGGCTGAVLCGRRHLPFWVRGRHASVCVCVPFLALSGRRALWARFGALHLSFCRFVLLLCAAPSRVGLPSSLSFVCVPSFFLFFTLFPRCSGPCFLCFPFPGCPERWRSALASASPPMPPPPPFYLFSFLFFCLFFLLCPAPPLSFSFCCFGPRVSSAVAPCGFFFPLLSFLFPFPPLPPTPGACVVPPAALCGRAAPAFCLVFCGAVLGCCALRGVLWWPALCFCGLLHVVRCSSSWLFFCSLRAHLDQVPLNSPSGSTEFNRALSLRLPHC